MFLSVDFVVSKSLKTQKDAAIINILLRSVTVYIDYLAVLLMNNRLSRTMRNCNKTLFSMVDCICGKSDLSNSCKE